jgi:small subunit ribosomal protein S4
MTKRIKRKFLSSRRMGVSLWGGKDAFLTKNYPPGAHGTLGYKKLTGYGVQLQAKQKIKKYYGNITEKQFHGIYEKASKKKGNTSQNLVGLLESRLDAVVYRAKLVPTVFAARQFVNHKHVKVNGKIVNIPSYVLKPGDIVEVKDASKKLEIIQRALAGGERSVPEYITVDPNKLTAEYMRIPLLEEIPYPTMMNPEIVVEFYSK